MHLRALRPFLLSVVFAIALAPLAAFAQLYYDGERRVSALSQAGKYREAIPLAEQYVAAAKERYGENAPQFAAALASLGELFRNTNRLSEAEPLVQRAAAICTNSICPDHLLKRD